MIDFLGCTQANPHWTVIYPNQHLANPKKTRSIILVNHSISRNNWEDLSIALSDVTGIQLHGAFGVLCIINIYNDCENNDSLKVVEEFMRGRRSRTGDGSGMREREGFIWLEDFNRHHSIWEKERNAHLFTKAALEVAQLLLNMISNHNMLMALAKDIPMLEACLTKNYTRVDNIFCLAKLLNNFVSCNMYPQW